MPEPHGFIIWLQTWSPHIWLFGSLFGSMLSATLFFRAHKALDQLAGSDQKRAWLFWRRHGLAFLSMHLGFVVVGVVSVLEIRKTWASALTLTILLAIPLVLAWRSYDSLRFMGGKR